MKFGAVIVFGVNLVTPVETCIMTTFCEAFEKIGLQVAVCGLRFVV